jgi:DNA-binding SARP family transcriptional activator
LSIKVRVLGDFRIERDGAVVELGAKAPTRALDILRMLAVSKDHACSLESADALWPDLDATSEGGVREGVASAAQIVGRRRPDCAAKAGCGSLPTGLIDLADWEARLQQPEC